MNDLENNGLHFIYWDDLSASVRYSYNVHARHDPESFVRGRGWGRVFSHLIYFTEGRGSSRNGPPLFLRKTSIQLKGGHHRPAGGPVMAQHWMLAEFLWFSMGFRPVFLRKPIVRDFTLYGLELILVGHMGHAIVKIYVCIGKSEWQAASSILN